MIIINEIFGDTITFRNWWIMNEMNDTEDNKCPRNENKPHDKLAKIQLVKEIRPTNQKMNGELEPSHGRDDIIRAYIINISTLLV